MGSTDVAQDIVAFEFINEPDSRQLRSHLVYAIHRRAEERIMPIEIPAHSGILRALTAECEYYTIGGNWCDWLLQHGTSCKQSNDLRTANSVYYVYSKCERRGDKIARESTCSCSAITGRRGVFTHPGRRFPFLRVPGTPHRPLRSSPV